MKHEPRASFEELQRKQIRVEQRKLELLTEQK